MTLLSYHSAHPFSPQSRPRSRHRKELIDCLSEFPEIQAQGTWQASDLWTRCSEVYEKTNPGRIRWDVLFTARIRLIALFAVHANSPESERIRKQLLISSKLPDRMCSRSLRGVVLSIQAITSMPSADGDSP